jgi:hypothetical protein
VVILLARARGITKVGCEAISHASPFCSHIRNNETNFIIAKESFQPKPVGVTFF